MTKFLLLAFLIIVFAAALMLLSPIDVIRCAPDRSCEIAHTLAGVYTFDREQASKLTTANLTSESHADDRSEYWKYNVTITGGGGSVATFPKSTSIPSNATVQASMQKYLSAPAGRGYFMLQTEVLVIIPVLLIFVAIHFVRLACRKQPSS
jgi:hypothetical protein